MTRLILEWVASALYANWLLFNATLGPYVFTAPNEAMWVDSLLETSRSRPLRGLG